MRCVFRSDKLTRPQIQVLLEWLKANGFHWLMPAESAITVRRRWITAPTYYATYNRKPKWDGYRPITLADSDTMRVKVRQVRVRVPFPSKAFRDAGLEVAP